MLHSAGIVSIAAKVSPEIYAVNVTGTKNIIQLCIAHGVEKLVSVSSVHAIPEHSGIISEVANFFPSLVHGSYGQTKAEATQAVLESATPGLDTCLRSNFVHSGNEKVLVVVFCLGAYLK